MASTKVTRRFEWIIQNLTRKKVEDPNFMVTSDPIYINLGSNMTKWFIALHSVEQKGIYSLGPVLKKAEVTRDDFQVSFSVKLFELQRNFDRTSRFMCRAGWPELIEAKDLFSPMNYFDNKSQLKLSFKLKIYYVCKEMFVEYFSNYSKYFGNSTLADFTIKSLDGEEFPVHRLILAEVSPFFEKMFTAKMQEKRLKLSSATFEDTSVVLKLVLKYIYSGIVEIDNYKLMIDTLNAAERFELPGLKIKCINKLITSVDASNVLEILAAADLYNSKQLEESCLELIIDNYDDLGEIDWKLLGSSLIKKIMNAALQNSSRYTLVSSV